MWGVRWVECFLSIIRVYCVVLLSFFDCWCPISISCPLTRFPVRLSSSLAGWWTFRGGNSPLGALPAAPSQHRSAGEAPGRGKPVCPGLPRFGHVEEGTASCSAPTQGLAAGSLLGQEREAGSGQRAAPATGCNHQRGLAEMTKLKKQKSHCLVMLLVSRWCWMKCSQYFVWSTRGQHWTVKVRSLFRLESNSCKSLVLNLFSWRFLKNEAIFTRNPSSLVDYVNELCLNKKKDLNSF